jgi:hypothetical protein
MCNAAHSAKTQAVNLAAALQLLVWAHKLAVKQATGFDQP